jgi:hypothetical protein
VDGFASRIVAEDRNGAPRLRKVRGKELGERQSIGVVYLAWQGLGPGSFERFVESYERRSAGREHDLIVIYAGFERQQALREAMAVFRNTPHVAFEFSDVRLDIGYYLELARRVDYEYLCILNTYTELCANNWLEYLHRHASSGKVGIVGATGSYESLLDSVGFQRRVIWNCKENGNKVSDTIEYYYKFLLESACPNASVEPAAALPGRRIERWMERAAGYIAKRERDHLYQTRWEQMTAPGKVFADYGQFPAFPNPHIRTSGFMLRRAHLTTFQPSQIKTKMDALAFESGGNGLTAQLRRAGLAAIVCANDGRGYDVRDWSRSGTFRQGDQSRLILTDNRCRDFATMPPGERSLHERITWGDYLGAPPADFPDFGYSFAKGALGPEKRPEVSARPLSKDLRYRYCRRALRWMRTIARTLPTKGGVSSVV